ncbi:damage-inducible protein [Micromonospora wenchangensis]|uniref:Damage-inducible protein n=1 Tax=Micromonospora wenchangensis TaxID=1185415 RepID=A0A246RTU9_9ACTN|nr:ATP-binding protein [Micromonospora wenchangensis]OWV13673.1 damage-inducible protein [Micromonospora wenchangensis]
MFSPQRVERVSKERLVFAALAGQPLPWEAGHELSGWRLRPDQTWQHVVYLGIYRLDELFEVLSRLFGPSPESYDERPAGESAVAAFTVDEHGHMLPDSLVLSSCAVATGELLRTRRVRTDLLSRLGAATEDLDESLQKRLPAVTIESEDGEPTLVSGVVDHRLLSDYQKVAVQTAGVDAALSFGDIRIRSQLVVRRDEDEPVANECCHGCNRPAARAANHDFLNSPIMRDLGRVAEKIDKGDVGVALRDYLRPETDLATTGRVDVRDRIDAVLAATAPRAVPAGRWPSHPEHALALNQQLAVSTALGTSAGILGVNGPPGTGKTTMLRDLVAALVVERARRLAALTDPARAFTGRQQRYVTGQRTRVVDVWQPDLTGFEMVVASANNGAVQNVTDEIPAADAIDDSWRERAAAADYFPDIATALLTGRPDAKQPQVVEQAWGLVAARLGNKTNRSRFLNTFWYHKPDKSRKGPGEGHTWSGMLAVLKGYEQTVPDVGWSMAVSRFRAAEARVEAVRRKRAEVYRDVERREHPENHLADLRHAVKVAADAVESARLRHGAALDAERERAAEADRIASALQAGAERDARRRAAAADQTLATAERQVEHLSTGRRATAERTLWSCEAELSRWLTAQAAHQRAQPGPWEWLRTLGEAQRRWSYHDGQLLAGVRQAQVALDAARAERAAVQVEIDVVQRAVDTARRQADEIRRTLAAGVPKPQVDHAPLTAARRTVASAEQELSTAVRTHRAAEDAIRAAEADLSALQARLVRAASALGRHFPDPGWHADRQRRESAALWTDREWNEARSDLFLAALALHKAFLRHNATRMRRNLQAAMDLVGGDAPADLAPEAALAAWQSLFFVVPVVSTTFASYDRVFGHLGREALGWLLIDEAGQATPQNAVGALWRTRRAVVVGDPLQLEPITTLPVRTEQAIRTERAVDEQWLTGRTSVQRLADRLTPLGTWLDGDGNPTWVGVPLTVHRRCDQPMFDIVNRVAYGGLMIDGTGTDTGARDRFQLAYPTLPPSKWIDVAGTGARGHWIPDQGRQLDRILATLAELDFDMSEVMVIGPFRDVARELDRRARRYPGLVAGTVHTAQGKQAEVVVLVLGGAPDRAGARRWASSRPNLLNVAVSRAKRRLYVIGDRQAWSPLPYFQILAAALPPQEPVRR